MLMAEATVPVRVSVPVREVAPASSPVCSRYPSMFVCGCTIPCRIAMKEVKVNRVIGNLFVGPVQAAYDVHRLKELRVKYIIDLSGSDYHRTPEEFQYTVIEIEGEV